MENNLKNTSKEFQELRAKRQRLKLEHASLFKKLSEILFCHDPIGISSSDNTDEYEPEVGTIIPRLADCKSSMEVQAVVFDELSRWFGSDEVGKASDYAGIANEIWEAWLDYHSSHERAEDGWNPVAYAQKMRKSTFPVSAFFLLDSPGAFSKCKQWLSLLEPYGMPSMADSRYFNDVYEIYQADKVVINFDFDFKLYWRGSEFGELLRCHFVGKGKYEIELWLPGVIADELADKFRDGHEGFFCAFMPISFYD